MQPSVINVGGSPVSYPVIVRPQIPNAAMGMFAQMQADQGNDDTDTAVLMALLQFMAGEKDREDRTRMFGEELALRREERGDQRNQFAEQMKHLGALREDASEINRGRLDLDRDVATDDYWLRLANLDLQGDQLDLLDRQGDRDFDLRQSQGQQDHAIRLRQLGILQKNADLSNRVAEAELAAIRSAPLIEAQAESIAADEAAVERSMATDAEKGAAEAGKIVSRLISKHGLDKLDRGRYVAEGFGDEVRRSHDLYKGVFGFADEVSTSILKEKDPEKRRKMAQALIPVVRDIKAKVSGLDTSNTFSNYPDWMVYATRPWRLLGDDPGESAKDSMGGRLNSTLATLTEMSDIGQDIARREELMAPVRQAKRDLNERRQATTIAIGDTLGGATSKAVRTASAPASQPAYVRAEDLNLGHTPSEIEPLDPFETMDAHEQFWRELVPIDEEELKRRYGY